MMKKPDHPAKPEKAHALTPIEELHHALHAMVVAAETTGDRDKPEVVAAREVLQKHEKHGDA